MVVYSAMARTRRYSIQIKDANGKSALFTAVHWDEENRRAAVAQILRLDGVLKVCDFAAPNLKAKGVRNRRSKAVHSLRNLPRPRTECGPCEA
jgi:hypothetical protein